MTAQHDRVVCQAPIIADFSTSASDGYGGTQNCFAALNEDSGCYEWHPEGLKVFEVDEAPPGSDVAAIKLGHISVTPLKAGFIPAVHA